MEKFLDSFFPFVILIVIAGTRIIAMVRRQARKRSQTPKPEEVPQSFRTASPQKTDRGFHPWEDEYRDPSSSVTLEGAELKVRQAVQADDDDDEEFSAWNLSINDELPSKPAPAVPPKSTDTGAPSIFTALSATSSVSVSREIPAWLNSLPQSVLSPADVRTTAATAQPSSESAPSGEDGSNTSPPIRRLSRVESRLRSLPPLQQGLVWAEILGTPKGLL